MLITITIPGDGSITREDAYFGEAINFNQTLFDLVCTSHHLYLCHSSLSQLKDSAKKVGHGEITLEAAALDRALRVNNSIAYNPEFAYKTPRIVGATAESGFMLAMFASNQTANTSYPVTVDEANHFFNLHKFPNGFHRRSSPYEFPEVIALTNTLLQKVGVLPGHNEGVNNYIVNEQDDETVRLFLLIQRVVPSYQFFFQFCLFYQKQVMLAAQLYPNPPPELELAIKVNMDTYYQALGNSSCPQLFPYGM